jgi:hypothetical protein
VFDVEDEGIEIGFIRDIPGFESPLPQMAASTMFFVEVNGVVHIELSHIFRKRRGFDFDEEMIMVGHEAVVMDRNVESLRIRADQLFEIFIILLVPKDHSLFDTAVDDMVEAGNLNAGFSGHYGLHCTFGSSIAQGRLGYHYHLTLLPFYLLLPSGSVGI